MLRKYLIIIIYKLKDKFDINGLTVTRMNTYYIDSTVKNTMHKSI